MAPTPEVVKFFLTDQSADPILGVLVQVFDITGTTFITQDYTVDVAGDAVAEVTIDGDAAPIQYTIRMSKTGVAFDGSQGDDSKSPQSIDVYSPAAGAPNGNNNFNIQGETFALPTATDPRMCRCSGFFKDGAGRALASLDIYLINQFLPAVVDGYGILGERLDLRSDEDGYVQLDLYRDGIYRAMVQSLQAAEIDNTGAIVFPREIVVPDRSSANIVDLLLPIVVGVVWDPTSVTVAAGAALDLTPTITASDFRELTGTALEDVSFEIEDTDVATVECQSDKLVITGVASGTTNLVVARLDESIVKIPDPGITGSPLLITVT